jgi:hypothetical protein
VGELGQAESLRRAGIRVQTSLDHKDLYLRVLRGQEEVERNLGSCMHVFLLSIPRLEFAALIPKGERAEPRILGEELDK